MIGIEQVLRGGNSRIYRVRCTKGDYALKSYPPRTRDPRERMKTEFQALRLLKAKGCECIPDPIAADVEANTALYEWVDGIGIENIDTEEIDAALGFIHFLHDLAKVTESASVAAASECCLSAQDILDQVSVRVERLRDAGKIQPELDRFLYQDLDPALEKFAAQTRDACTCDNVPIDEPLARRYRTLSPSDFGFHNALQRADRSIVFLDFEYFGWDDPVKLTSDFLWHPGMNMSALTRLRFAQGARSLFSKDPDFATRLRRHHPLFGLRWCTIMLNEFLPEGIARRCHAVGAIDIEATQRIQLSKARAIFAAASSTTEESKIFDDR